MYLCYGLVLACYAHLSLSQSTTNPPSPTAGGTGGGGLVVQNFPDFGPDGWQRRQVNANSIQNSNPVADNSAVPVVPSLRDTKPVAAGGMPVQFLPPSLINSDLTRNQDKQGFGANTNTVGESSFQFPGNNLIATTGQLPKNNIIPTSNKLPNQPFDTTNANRLPNDLSVKSNTGIQPVDANSNRFPNRNMFQTRVQRPIQTDAPQLNQLSINNIRTSTTGRVQVPINPGVNNQVLQTQTQEFTQREKTTFDVNTNNALQNTNALKSNLNNALGFRNRNPNRNFQQTGRNSIKQCVGAIIKPVYMKNNRQILDVTHFLLGSEILACPYGTGYSLDTCNCDYMSDVEMAQFYETIGDPMWGKRCNEDILLNFNNGVRDNTMNHWYVDSQGITTGTGMAEFNGKSNTSLTIPKYRGYDLQQLAFEFKFKSKAAHRDHPHPLITNCESHSSVYRPKNQEPTYGVILNSNSDFVTFFVKVEQFNENDNFFDFRVQPTLQTKFVTLKVDPSIMNTVRYSFDGQVLRAEVNGQKDQVVAKGRIANRKENPMSIGSCLRYGTFEGQLDDVRIYSTCIPNWK